MVSFPAEFVNQFLIVDLSPMRSACVWRRIDRYLQLEGCRAMMLIVCIKPIGDRVIVSIQHMTMMSTFDCVGSVLS